MGGEEPRRDLGVYGSSEKRSGGLGVEGLGCRWSEYLTGGSRLSGEELLADPEAIVVSPIDLPGARRP